MSKTKSFMIGVSNSFIRGRWSNPQDWIKIISELGVDFWTLSHETIYPSLLPVQKASMINNIVEISDKYSIPLMLTKTPDHLFGKTLILNDDYSYALDHIHYLEDQVNIATGLDTAATGGYIGIFNHNDITLIKNVLLKKENNVVNSPDDSNYYYSQRFQLLEQFPINLKIKFFRLIDTLKYFSNLVYNAGLEYFYFQLPYFESIINAMYPNSDNTAEKKEIINFLTDYIYFTLNILNNKLNYKNTMTTIDSVLRISLDTTTNLTEPDLYPSYYKLAPFIDSIFISQTDGNPLHKWPFTEEYNHKGLIKPDDLAEFLRNIMNKNHVSLNNNDDQINTKRKTNINQNIKIILNIEPDYSKTNQQIIDDLKYSIKMIKDIIV
ncbi:MAG: hypothetical protein ACTSU2_14905 [Promethearchaeota archaeon]